MIANKHSQNDTVGRTTNQSWISLPSFILSAIDSQKQRITAKFNKISNHHQYHVSAIHLSRCASVRTRISPNPFEICISCTSPLLVLSLPTKHYKFSGFTKTDLNMKIHFKTTRQKRLRIQSRTNLRRYICIHCSPQWPQILSTIHGFFHPGRK